MVKIEIQDDGNLSVLEMSGNVIELTCRAVTIVHVMYEALKEYNEKVADHFKSLVLKSIILAFENEEELEEHSKSSEDKVKEMLKELSELADKASKLIS